VSSSKEEAFTPLIPVPEFGLSIVAYNSCTFNSRPLKWRHTKSTNGFMLCAVTTYMHLWIPNRILSFVGATHHAISRIKWGSTKKQVYKAPCNTVKE